MASTPEAVIVAAVRSPVGRLGGALAPVRPDDLAAAVITAALVPPAASAPEHCHVFLMAQPEINIEVNLPTNWNGRFYMFGNGGWAGESFDAAGRVANRNAA